MVDLSTFKESIANMTEEELIDKLAEIRAQRRKKPERKQAKKKKPSTTKLTREEKLELLAALKEM